MSESPEQFKARMDARYTRDGSYGPLPIIRVITDNAYSRKRDELMRKYARLEAVAADMREAEIEFAYADRDDEAALEVIGDLVGLGIPLAYDIPEPPQ